jgi:hypothetical protein
MLSRNSLQISFRITKRRISRLVSYYTGCSLLIVGCTNKKYTCVLKKIITDSYSETHTCLVGQAAG